MPHCYIVLCVDIWQRYSTIYDCCYFATILAFKYKNRRFEWIVQNRTLAKPLKVPIVAISKYLVKSQVISMQKWQLE